MEQASIASAPGGDFRTALLCLGLHQLSDTHGTMVTQGEIRTIIENEENDLRFEQFVNRLVSTFAGRPVLNTARTGDLGVDGRAVQLDALSEELIVASSIRKDAVAKMKEDALRIRGTQAGAVVYFCTNAHLLEAKKLSTRRSLETILGGSFRVTVLTQDELSDLASRYAGPFLEFYSLEIHDLRERLVSTLSQPGGTTQLQIAHVLTSAEGFQNRDAIAGLLVTEVVARRASTANEVTVGLQALLRMPASFPRTVAERALGRLVESGMSRVRQDGRFELTEQGRKDRSERLEGSHAEELARKSRFGQEVASRLGYAVAPEQEELLWKHLMHEMSSLLSRVGSRFVALVEAARANADLNEVRALASDSIRAACVTAPAGIENDQVRDETAEALYQSLLEVPSLALEWLEGTIAAWLAACQLGLIPEVSQQLEPALQRLALALDTDIVLSLLCDTEPDNDALTTLLSQWTAIGGRTLIVEEVLKEVAHHAWIARVEFHEIASIVKTLRYEPGLARQIARNAFVRAFWASGRPVTTAEFDRFIGSYAGKSESDISEIERTLHRISIGHLLAPPTVAMMAPFRNCEAQVRRVLSRTARFAPNDASGGAIEQDKMNRDAAAVVRYAATAHSSPHAITSLLLLSSSKRLRIAVRQGASHVKVIVAPTSTLGLLLAAVSKHQASPNAIAQLLLAEGAREQVGHMRGELVRMLARADLLKTLPRARIVSLEREVEAGIIEYARKSARSRTEVRRDVLTATDRDAMLHVLSEALRKNALGAEADKLIRAQAEEITRLRGEFGER